VRFSYVVEPERSLPEGMNTLVIEPANLSETTDPKWSQMCANLLSALVNESRLEFGTDVAVSDRRDTQATFEEHDLEAAGMSTGSGATGRLLGAQGRILGHIDVKVEKHIGKQRTLAGLDLSGFGGHGWGGGRTKIETREVDTVTRNLTVQANFKLVDTNNRVWDQTSSSHRSTDQTKASPFFGSSQTEAALTPQDRVIGTLVERGAREFISRLMPCRIEVEAEVVSSRNKDCLGGVRMLRAEAYGDAVALFNAALKAGSNDHRAAYGAGVACEAAGRYDEALSFYRRACVGQQNPVYVEARDRMKAYGQRARP
jgi:tetratricopeptide (TPR) repeat protein